jgi:alanyl-tRNA synthetase
MDEASNLGAIAFFGDKYGDIVRVLEAGSSIELCGGTHVRATGDIGLVMIVGESSIGSNLRRIEALTGKKALEYFHEMRRTLSKSSSLLSSQPAELASTIRRTLDELRATNNEVQSLRSAVARSRAEELVREDSSKIVRRTASGQGKSGGVGTGAVTSVVRKVEVKSVAELRELALSIRAAPSIKAVVLGALTDTGGVALVAAVGAGFPSSAGDLIKDAARAIGGGGGGKGDIATAGGNNPAGLEDALKLARRAIAKVLEL